MRVSEIVAGGATQLAPRGESPALARLLEIGVLANDAQSTRAAWHVRFAGDPTEVALLAAAAEAGLAVAGLRAGVAIVEEYPFDDVRKRMSVVYERDAERRLAMKGAPEAVLAACSAEVSAAACPVVLSPERRAQILATAEEMAAHGLRVLAFAEGHAGPRASEGAVVAEANLTFVGLAGLEDPPRTEARGAIATLRAAGVRVLMLTGDHPATARAIAERVGIDGGRVVPGREVEQASVDELRRLTGEASVCARITPEHKLRIVEAVQSGGEVVAVTGDGVNDAPALRRAAIGIAMGQTGTDVAREAADLVLADDNLATVVTATRAGRVLYANLRKAVRYYLAAKVALVTASLVAVLVHLPIPFAPVQIIVMELCMDLGASVTFTTEPPDGDVMARPPRDPRQPFMDRSMQVGIFAGGLSLAAAVLAAYLSSRIRSSGQTAAQTAAFVSWMVGHVVLAAHMRSEREPLLRRGTLSNRPFLLWTAAVAARLVLGLTVPPIEARFHLTSLSSTAWFVAVGAGLLFPSWWEVARWLRWRQEKSQQTPSPGTCVR